MSNKVKFTSKQKMFLTLKFREFNTSFFVFYKLYNIERIAIHEWSIKYNKEFKELKEISNEYNYSIKFLCDV